MGGGHSYSIRAWDNDDQIIYGYSLTPSSTTMTSLTTEMYGILSTTILILCLTKDNRIENPSSLSVPVYCDNEQAINMCNDKKPCLNISETLQPENDLKLLIQQIQSFSPVNIKYLWIKSHQDELKCGTKIHGPFSRPVQINIEMDGLAKEITQPHRHYFIKRPIFNTTKIGIYNEQQVYVTYLQKQLTAKLGYKALWNYLANKYNWNEDIMTKIHLTALETTLDKYKPQYCTKIMQMMHDWQYTGDRKILFRDGEGKCPMSCGQVEGKMHYLWCSNEKFTSTRLKHLKLLQSQMKAMNSYPGITTVIGKIHNLGFDNTWIDDLETNNEIERHLKETILEQKSLGSNSIAKGYIIYKW